MDYLEILGAVVGLIYLYWEYKASAWLWLASIIMPAIYLVVYYNAGLYADFGLSVYYILASVYGWLCWLRGRKSDSNITGDSVVKEQETAGIMPTPSAMYLPLCVTFMVLFGIVGYILKNFTDSTVPWADGFTTALSIVALWMLAKKYLEQWIVWIVADMACAILYAYKGLWLTGGLYLLYSVIAVFGYRKWKNMLEK